MDVARVPIQTVARSSKMDPGCFVAKSAVRFKNWLGQSTLVHGFSFGMDKERAEYLSRNEVLERLFAHYDFVGREALEWISWPEHILKGEVGAHEVLLGPTPGGYARLDASGLGWHQSVEAAEKHTLLEVVERHLLCKWWYGTMKLKGIGAVVPLSNGFKMEFATADLPKAIPFVVCVISHELNFTWLCGAAVCTSFQLAMEKAKNEALMLLDGVLSNDKMAFNPNKETMEILLSLRRSNVSKMRRQFHEATLGKQQSNGEDLPIAEMDVDEIVQCTLGKDSIIKLVVIRNNEEGSLVRVLCDSALKVKEMRRLKGPERVTDPFC